jgi:hypothetical protein
MRLPPTTLGGPPNGYLFGALEGLMIVALRLSSPHRWGEMTTWFNSDDTRLRKIFAYVRDEILMVTAHLLDFNPLKVAPALQRFQIALQAKLGLAPSGVAAACFGFIDMKFWPVCRPRLNEDQDPLTRVITPDQRQRSLYTTYKRSHGLTCLSLMMLNGISFFWGPIEVSCFLMMNKLSESS